ncbi:MAG: tetratricopeptide repeat protein [Rikenellaceae bacterium]
MNTDKHSVEDPEQIIESALDRTESYIEKNFKTLIIAVGAIIVITGSYFGYRSFIESPRIENASAAAFVAEQYFQQDSFALALNGNDYFEGFIEIADSYSSTPIGNMANHYAGICYLKLGDFNNAASYLKRYNRVEGEASAVINAQNIGLLGDIAVEQGDNAAAIKQYALACEINNDFTAPMYLKKLGLMYELEGNNAKALEAYNKISVLYPSSLEGRDIEKFIGRIEK